jgi:hypothetical protein
MGRQSRSRVGFVIVTIALLLGLFAPTAAATASQGAPPPSPKPKVTTPSAFDTSPPLRAMPSQSAAPAANPAAPTEVRPDRGPDVPDRGHSGDGALESGVATAAVSVAAIPGTLANFEGLRNTDNSGQVNPPDPIGDVGPNHYVEMVNVSFAIYNKQGTRLVGPTTLGALWAGFAVTDCAANNGDPVVVHDQFADRWILLQFTTQGPEYWNCIAVSQTADPTGAYYRYAFSAGQFFPDYPKLGVWSDSYIMTTREFGPTVEYGIGVYGLEKSRMLAGDPSARMVRHFLDGNAPGMLPLVGDGLLPPDVDGARLPTNLAAPIVGTQDDDHPYGATFDALNIWQLSVQWLATPTSSLTLATQLPVAEFDSVFPCAPTGRDCLPQPDITSPDQRLDILSYRQRPTWRLAYRNFGTYEALVTNQAVEARPGIAGVRWYEIRRAGGAYSLFQQGTYAPEDGINRWMGSAAMDGRGNIALGYSVVSGTVYPGIRYTARLQADPPGTMPQGEGVIINGSGSQLTTNSRWGDYTSLNVDPTDDCTFWYVNEYYETTSLAGWQTRIASFRLPGCTTPLFSQVRGTATYGDATATLTATLTGPGSLPLAGATVAFTLGGIPVGTAMTNAQGVATLTGAPIPAGLNAGSYANQVCASYAGNGTYLPAGPTCGPLVVARRILWVKPIDRTVGLRQPNPPTTPPAGCLAQQTATSACWLELARGSAFVSGDDWGDLSLAQLRFTYNRNPPATNAAETVGKTYRITAFGVTSQNYDIRYDPGTLRVVAAP